MREREKKKERKKKWAKNFQRISSAIVQINNEQKCDIYAKQTPLPQMLRQKRNQMTNNLHTI